MSSVIVELITLDNSNYLGLKTTVDQRPNSLLKSRRFPWISREGMSTRLDLLRQGYLDIYQEYLNTNNPAEKGTLEIILQNLSTGVENPLERFAAEIKKYPNSVGSLDRALASEDKRQFDAFNTTLGDAQRNNGVLWVGGDRNKHLANILTCFTYLFGTKPQDNPLMHNYGGSVHETSQDLLLRDCRQENPAADIESPKIRRKAVEQYMARISGSIIRIIKMTPQELEQTFPDDNVKHKAIVRKLKNEFNRLAVQVNYNYRFKNLQDEFNDKSENYLLVKLKPGDKFYQFLEAKFSWRIKKRVLLVLAIVFALFIAAGQASIAIFAVTGVATMVAVGSAALVTNTLLFFRDIKAMLITIFSGRLFNGMNKGLKALAGLFFTFSAVTGTVLGGLAFVALVGLSGATIISAAPWWVLMVAGIVGVVTVVGITALMFMAAISFVRSLRGNSLTGLISGAAKKIKSFFFVPLFNQSLVNMIKERRKLVAELSAVDTDFFAINPVQKKLELQAKISAITSEIRVEKMSHYVRHFTKVIIKLLLVPFAILVAGVSTVAYMSVTAKATADTLKAVFAWSDVLSTTVANILTWGPALVVRGTLNIKNAINAADFISAKIAKVLSGGAYTVSILASLTRHGLLLKAIKGSFQVVRDNPLKVIVPGIRTAISAVLCLLVALNGYGVGQTNRRGAILFETHVHDYLPNWITSNIGTLGAICGTSISVAMNLMSVNNTSATDTPFQHLDKKAEPPPATDQQDDELIPWGAEIPVNKGPGFWGSVPKTSVSLNSLSPKPAEEKAPLLNLFADFGFSKNSPDVAQPNLEIYEERVEQISYQCR